MFLNAPAEAVRSTVKEEAGAISIMSSDDKILYKVPIKLQV